MVTLTYRDEDLPGVEEDHWRDIRNLRRRCDRLGIVGPLLVPEWGGKTGRLHFHGALPRWTALDLMREAWPHGFVSLNAESMRQCKGVSEREAARIVARYVSSYVTKGATGAALRSSGAGGPRGVGFNRRRYSIPKGTTVPAPVRISSDNLHDLWAEAQSLCGHSLEAVWTSDQADNWEAPPTMLLRG